MTETNKNETHTSNKSSKNKARAPAFTLPESTLNENKFLTFASELPSDWDTNQEILAALFAAKNAANGCIGFLIPSAKAAYGSDHMTLMLREGKHVVRTARGYGSTSGQTVKANKAKEGSVVDLFNQSNADKLAEEIGMLKDRLAKAEKIYAAITAANA